MRLADAAPAPHGGSDDRPAPHLGHQPAQGARPPTRRQSAPNGELSARVVVAVRTDPGKTVAEYAELLGVPPTALYRPVRRLTTEGALVKRARQLFPNR
jgi:hypothetical protein